MLEKWIRGLARARWLVVVLWIALTAGSVLTLPDLTETVKQAEWNYVPKDAETAHVKELMRQISPELREKSNAVIVLHREGGLQEGDNNWLKGIVTDLDSNKEQMDITAIMSTFKDADLEPQLVSEDKSTHLVAIGLANEANNATTQDMIDKLDVMLEDVPEGADAYLTGAAPIQKSLLQSTQEGMKKTEVLTVSLVVVILLAVFRSPIAPLVPLITIALSFVLTRGLVAVGTEFGLPVSSFTEIFIVAVLFGAGTDYCILLIHRFREELSKTDDRVEALIQTMRTVGKTVIFSGSTVLIAFFMIGFAKFGLYQSAAGVAVGMFITLLAGMTLTPALMVILGPKMFWPFQVKKGQGHGDSKLWGWMGKITSKRPVLVFIVTTLALAPLTLLFDNVRSYDDLAVVGEDVEAVKGFRVVEDNFSSGHVLPMSVSLTSSETMRTPERLAALERVSEALTKFPQVEQVRSATRPLGEQLEDLTIPSMLKEVNKGITEINDGTAELKDGLSTAKNELTEGVDGIGEMSDALSLITEKQREAADGSSQIAKGATEAAAKLGDGAKQLQAGLPQVDQMHQGLTQIAGKTREVQAGLGQSAGALTQVQQGLVAIGQGITQSQGVAASMGQDLAALVQAHPELANDPAYQMLAGKQQGLAQGLTEAGQGLTPITQGIAQVTPGLQQMQGGVGQLADAQAQIAAGVGQLRSQTATLVQGLQEASTGLNQIGTGASQLTSGLNQLADGTGEMKEKVGTFKTGLTDLQKGLGEGTDALDKMSDGLTEIHEANQGIADNNPKQVVGWYLPESELNNAELKKAFDSYISPDGKITKFEIVLNINPYSHEAMSLVESVRSTVERTLAGSAIVAPELMIGGQTAEYELLDGISADDFVRTGAMILIGIYLVLALLLRSVLAPIYLLLSLGFSYLVTMGIVEWIFVDLMGRDGLQWTDSFFVFILLVALGVDYSIFLMARFKEEYVPGQIVPAMQRAMSSTGGVIMSAAVIMGGTFAALMFSGVSVLAEIGASVLIGLAIYTTIVMGLIVPAMAILFGEANWWPFKPAGSKKKEQKQVAMDL